MALLIELSPKLVIDFEDQKSSREVLLRSGDLYKILNKYNQDNNIYLAAGSNVGEEIKTILLNRGSSVKHIKIKDGAKIEVRINYGHNLIIRSEADHKVTFDDNMEIKKNFVSSLFKEDLMVLPVYDLEREFALEFLRKANEYHKDSVIFGDHAIRSLSENPTVAIIDEEAVIEYAPFKIISEYELINFSYSLCEGKNTKLLLTTNFGLLFYDGDTCLQYDLQSYNKDMIYFAYTFALENKMDSKDIPKFVVAASQVEPGTKVGEIMSLAKTFKGSVLHRWLS